MAEYPALDLRFRQVGEHGVLDDLLYGLLDDYQPIAIQEHDAGDGWLVFFRAASARDAAAAALAPFQLRAELTITPRDVPDEDWARRSQANLTAVRVGRFVIAPPWDPAVLARDADPDQILIVIDPSMGFGTGHHQTTRLCLALLQREELCGRRMLDVGTGSGVLAIAAWRLGASSVTAMDYDPDALLNARENIERNGAAADIEVECADLPAFRTEPAAVVTANLTAAVLIQYAASLRALLSVGGVLIVSGFSPAELPQVSSALALPLVDHRVEGDWVAAIFRV